MIMEDILKKISSYNLFNYLFPGTLFAVLADRFTHYSFIQNDLLSTAFLYYFIGLVISRVGSLIIEPFLKWVHFLRFAQYTDYVAASQKDPQVPEFSEVNNTYRTLCSMFLVLIALKIYEMISPRMIFLGQWQLYILLGVLFIIFIASYRKQTEYVRRRIELGIRK